MTDAQFQDRAEACCDAASANADRINALNKEVSNIGDANRYLSLARTAAQESELWLGKAMVAFASGGSGNGPQG
jgi:hypothetical protein